MPAASDYSRRGCAARLPRPACAAELAAQMPASRLLAVRCSLTSPRLRWQGSLLGCMPHQAPTRVGCAARLLRPTCDGRARCSDAASHLLAQGALLSLNRSTGRQTAVGSAPRTARTRRDP
eukprot:scaffold4130_cov52-Phaeocystis_antarctica.AAC.1